MLVFLGYFITPLIDLINTRISDSNVRQLVALIIASLFGTLFSLLETSLWEGLTFLQIVGSIGVYSLATAEASHIAYKGLPAVKLPGWENSKAREELGLDATTSGKN